MPTTVYDQPEDAVPRHVLIDLMHTLKQYARDVEDGEGMAEWMNSLETPLTDKEAVAYMDALSDANQYIGQLIGVSADDL